MMEWLAFVSCRPLWVRCLAASIIVPIAVVLDCCVLACSRRATCCCCCCGTSLVILVVMMTFHLSCSYVESTGPLLVSHDGFLLAAPVPISTRLLSAKLGPETYRTVQAIATIVVAALRLIARSAYVLVSILEWIAGLP